MTEARTRSSQKCRRDTEQIENTERRHASCSVNIYCLYFNLTNSHIIFFLLSLALCFFLISIYSSSSVLFQPTHHRLSLTKQLHCSYHGNIRQNLRAIDEISGCMHRRHMRMGEYTHTHTHTSLNQILKYTAPCV